MVKKYKEALDFIYSRLPIFTRQGPAALKYDLTNITKLCSRLDNPQNKFRSIHIAGTNGKGTTSHLLASIFQEAGYKTGLHTSPHYKDFRERIKVNGKFISKSYLTKFINKSTGLISELEPSYFELSVALAFDYFASENVDIAIIEVGMGGRLDSTNIITPLLSVITNISYDHTQFLGDTLAEIALEKAGIIKTNIPVVAGEKSIEYKDVFIEKAGSLQSELFFTDDIISMEIECQSIDRSVFNIRSSSYNKTLKLRNSGPFIIKNLKYSLAAIEVFRDHYKEYFAITDDSIIQGLENFVKNTKYIGRWKIMGRKPYIIADGAHNLEALDSLFNFISKYKFNQKHIILGLVSDKSWNDTLSIFPTDAKYYFTKAGIPRALNEKMLQEMGAQYNLSGNTFSDVNSALNSAKSAANQNDIILIIGSIYLVGEIT